MPWDLPGCVFLAAGGIVHISRTRKQATSVDYTAYDSTTSGKTTCSVVPLAFETIRVKTVIK